MKNKKKKNEKVLYKNKVKKRASKFQVFWKARRSRVVSSVGFAKVFIAAGR